MSSNRRVASFRLSLFASLGLLPLACGGSTGAKPTCSSPQTDPQTGVVSCGEGYRYRSKSGSCGAGKADVAPAPIPDPHALPPLTGSVNCTNDPAVCDAYQYGFCVTPAVPQTMSFCASGCASDADCGPNGFCRCDGATTGTCTFDDCNSDDECEPGYHCASYDDGCGASAFACQTSRDDCAACQGPESSQKCVLRGDHWQCGGASVCGRPFLVQTEARTAYPMTRSDWTIALGMGPQLDHLRASERAVLAKHWTHMGQLEHASIAAFARFGLQLLALGAPAELVEACTQALADETAHTQLCFSLASRYAGRSLGPGPLDIAHCLEVTSLAGVTDLVIAEGCFGETRAALEALESAATASDPVIVAAYSRIAEDEQRHAVLAFQFVRWALEHDYPTVADRIAAALAFHPADGVVVPCLEALLALKRAA